MDSRDPVPMLGTASVVDSRFDAVVLVTDTFGKLIGDLAVLRQPVDAYAAIDKTIASSVVVITSDVVPSKRLVFSATGPLNRDYDDVRAFYDAASSGIKRAVSAGSRAPLLVRAPDSSFPDADLVTVLGALHALYVPLEIREAAADRKTKADKLGIWGVSEDAVNRLIATARGLETGRIAARDIGGSDPERMAAPAVQSYVEALFASTSVKVEVIQGSDNLEREYPLLAAVNRATKAVPRHHGRVIHLTYEGAGPIEETVLLVGKGITYDTGGADIKAGGHMAGMHRDKCGAAAVAGFFKTLDILRPKGIKVVGAMCVVRNSVGAECYVADEIITSRAGKRVRVGNTDAEGRMVMADVLCHIKEKALGEVNPKIFTWATLTGHVIIAHGENYTAVLGNGPACSAGIPEKLVKAGADLADPCHLSFITREDYEFANGKSEYEDLLQCNNKPSSQTPRGHQFPAAFMIMASGLDKHGKESDKPLSYVHVDVAGSAGPFPGIPTASPLLAFAKAFIMPRV